ncbi:uncharacterized protein B4U79_07875, partial [Dinothrombium tinctorium]
GLEDEPIYRLRTDDSLDSIHRCLQILTHTHNCRVPKCNFGPCPRMRRVILHSFQCRRRPNQQSACPVCKQLITLSTYHAKKCKDNTCRIPYCSIIKAKLREHLAEAGTSQSSNQSLQV